MVLEEMKKELELEAKKERRRNALAITSALVSILAIIAVVLRFYIFPELRAARNLEKVIADGIVVEMPKLYTMDHPSETYYRDLKYVKVRDLGSDNFTPEELKFMPLCTELAAENKCVFEADSEYMIRYRLSDQLLEEAAQGGDWEVEIRYSSSVDTKKNPYPMILVRIFNRKTGHLFMGLSHFNAEDNLTIQHRLAVLPDGGKGLSLKEYFQGDLSDMESLEFILRTTSGANGRIRQSANGSNDYYHWAIIPMDQQFEIEFPSK